VRRIAERANAPATPSRSVPSRTVRAALVFAMGLAAARGAAGQDRPVQTVAKVDLSRYVGEWFEIARFPNRFQRQCLGDVRAVYAIRQDGRLDVVNRCRTDDGVTEARGVARVVDSRSAAKLKVRFAPAVLSFLPAVWGDYWVVGLAPDYSWATVGSPDRKYLWILGRTSSIGTAAYAAALEAARSNGFDVARLIRTEQAGAAK
jgi:apolipoprotein D and lipocalin family protein